MVSWQTEADDAPNAGSEELAPGEFEAAVKEGVDEGVEAVGTLLDEAASDGRLKAFMERHGGTYEHLDVNKLKEHHRVWLVLVDSENKEDWGMVEDTLGELLWVPGKGEVVGTWSRSKVDNRIHISLLTHISALEDRSVQIWAKHADERIMKKQGKAAGTGTKKPRKKKEEEDQQALIEAQSVESRLQFNSMRAKLKGASKK